MPRWIERERKRENAAAHLGHNTITISAASNGARPGNFFPAVLWNPKRRPRRVFVFEAIMDRNGSAMETTNEKPN
jgi:hypothetical protein